jgi:plasmid rolling circle replication initiator protein Rep
MGWEIQKSNGNNYELLNTITMDIVAIGSKQKILNYMKKSLQESAKYGIKNKGLLLKGGGISYPLKTPKKQKISINTYISSALKGWKSEFL